MMQKKKRYKPKQVIGKILNPKYLVTSDPSVYYDEIACKHDYGSIDIDCEIVKIWFELRMVIDSIELDVMKNANGNVAAGVRSRRGYRDIKLKMMYLISRTIELDKEYKIKYRENRVKRQKRV